MAKETIKAGISDKSSFKNAGANGTEKLKSIKKEDIAENIEDTSNL